MTFILLNVEISACQSGTMKLMKLEFLLITMVAFLCNLFHFTHVYPFEYKWISKFTAIQISVVMTSQKKMQMKAKLKRGKNDHTGV